MLIKWFGRGEGSTARAVDYLLGDLDHKGEVRDEVRVLRGDPAMVALVGDSLTTKWHYSSGSVSWGEDRPTAAQIEAVVADLERVVGAGLAEDALCWSVIQHGRAGDRGVHAHVLVARTNLETGASYNPARPGWARDYDALRDLHNVASGWSRPDDPARSRTPAAAGVRAWRAGQAATQGEVEAWRDALTGWAVAQVRAGRVTDRAQLVEQMRAAGVEVAREVKGSVSVMAGDTRVRLTGAVWGREWAEPIPTADPAASAAQVARLRAHLEDRINHRAQVERTRTARTLAAAARRAARAPEPATPEVSAPPSSPAAAALRAALAEDRGSGHAWRRILRDPITEQPAFSQVGNADREDDHRGTGRTDAARRAAHTRPGLDRAAADLDRAAGGLADAAGGLADAARGLDRAAGRSDRAGDALDRAGDALDRARDGLAAAARRAWALLKGWLADYPPDQPKQRYATPPVTPAALPTLRSRRDPLNLDGWDGPTTRGGGFSR